MASTVEWMLVQICLCRKYKKFGQQGIQKKMLPFESSQVLQAGSPTLVGETLSLEIIDRILRAALERVHTHEPWYLVG